MGVFRYYTLTIGAVEWRRPAEKYTENCQLRRSPFVVHKRKVDHMRTKTISDYPLLIGELIRRSELRKARRQRWSAFFKINRLTQKD
jgi:hypothetical protein